MWVDDPLQHLSRAAGFGAYVVLWLDMCLGVSLSGRMRLPFLARWRVGDLHQFTGLLGLGLLATHVAVLVGLKQQAFTPAELFVPLVRQLNPLAPLLGITGAYALLLVTLASRARRFINNRMWRQLHMFSFVAFVLSLGHAIVAGPDASMAWVRAMYIGTVALLLGLTARRIAKTLNRDSTFPERVAHAHQPH